MAWLRVDDGFTKHPKFEGWTPAQRWAWLEVMEYCARYRTGGRIPSDLTLLPRSVTAAFLTKAEKARWCSRDDDGSLWINDWEAYNPARIDGPEALEQAVETAIRNHPEASANEIVRAVGGNRKQVLELIRRFQAGSAGGSEEPVPELVTRAGAARVPVPSRPQEPLSKTAAASTPDAAAALIDKLDELALNGTARELALTEPDRAQAWIDLAETEADRNPAAFVLAGLKSRAWPSPRGRTRRTTTTPPCPECGLGGNQHTTDCPTLTARLERAHDAAVEGEGSPS